MSRKRQKTNRAVTDHFQEVNFIPKTSSQEDLIYAIIQSAITMAIGPAGTGKTYISASMAAQSLVRNDCKKIVLSRANVPTGRTLGHFPGTVEDKLTPWLTPALDVLRQQLGDGRYKYSIEKNIIQMQPLETIRGRSFENTFIIIDESQNLSKEETVSIVTRLGKFSKLVLLGDPFQTDIKGENGLVWFEKFVYRNKLDIPVVKFNLDDVVRSKIVKDILVALYKEAGK